MTSSGPRSLVLLAAVLILLPSTSFTQSRLYDPGADADEAFRQAVSTATEEGKHVLVQVGGNWCRWCLKLDALMRDDAQIDSLLHADYVLLRVNYSKENRNADFLATLGNPQRFGFPVLLVVDGGGAVLHIQDSALLESGDGHDPERVRRFLSTWTRSAVHWSAGER